MDFYKKLVYKRIQKGGNYSKEERNKRRETIQGNTVYWSHKLFYEDERVKIDNGSVF